MDKRQFHSLLNDMKDAQPESIHLIESIQDAFDQSFEAISDSEKRALKTFPMQFIKRIPQEQQEWTTQLHVWAENGVPEILNIDPMLLAHKNSWGDSVLTSLIVGALGAYTEVIDYDLIRDILECDLSYEDVENDDTTVVKNVLEVTDINGQTPIELLVDYALGKGKYEGQETDEKLIQILREFAELQAAKEPEPEPVEEPEPELEPVEIEETEEQIDEEEF